MSTIVAKDTNSGSSRFSDQSVKCSAIYSTEMTAYTIVSGTIIYESKTSSIWDGSSFFIVSDKKNNGVNNPNTVAIIYSITYELSVNNK